MAMQALYGHPEGEVPPEVLATDFVVAIPTHYASEHRIAATRSSRLVTPRSEHLQSHTWIDKINITLPEACSGEGALRGKAILGTVCNSFSRCIAGRCASHPKPSSQRGTSMVSELSQLPTLCKAAHNLSACCTNANIRMSWAISGLRCIQEAFKT